MASFQIHLCADEACRLRFPLPAAALPPPPCPRCGSPTRPDGPIYGRQTMPPFTFAPFGPPVEALLDNVRSVYNVGSIFRTADGAGVRHLHLCGITATPAHPRLAKTALGAEQSVPWSYHRNALDAALARRQQGCRLLALAGGPRAVPLFDLLPELSGPPMLLVVGNELSGVDPAVLKLCHQIACLPMAGVKHSLNVVVAFGIAVYLLRWGQSLSL